MSDQTVIFSVVTEGHEAGSTVVWTLGGAVPKDPNTTIERMYLIGDVIEVFFRVIPQNPAHILTQAFCARIMPSAIKSVVEAIPIGKWVAQLEVARSCADQWEAGRYSDPNEDEEGGEDEEYEDEPEPLAAKPAPQQLFVPTMAHVPQNVPMPGNPTPG